MKKLLVVFLIILVSFTVFAEDENDDQNKLDNLINKVDASIPQEDSFHFLKRVNIEPEEGKNEILLSSNFNDPDFSLIGMGFGKYYNSFTMVFGVNLMGNVIFNKTFGVFGEMKFNVGEGEVGFAGGGSYSLLRKDNTILLILAGVSTLISKNNFQLGADVALDYNYFLNSNWFVKVGLKGNIIFFDTYNKGGFSLGVFGPTLSAGYKF